MIRIMGKELTARELQSMGGNARAKKLTDKRRKEIAQGAAQARWKAHKKVKP